MANEQEQTGSVTPGYEDQGREGQGGEWQGRAEGNPQGISRAERGTPERYRAFRSSSPLSAMRRLSDEMDRIFDDFFTRSFGELPFAGLDRQQSSSGTLGMSFWPELELSQREGKLVIQADLPGLRREDVKVELKDDELSISGERRSAREHEEGGFYRSERSYGSFRRTVPLPEGAKADTASATFENGVLRVEIEAPAENAQGRRIEVREGKTH